MALCSPHLDQLIVCSARLTAYRLKCQGKWRDAGLDHTKLGVFQKYPFTEKQKIEFSGNINLSKPLRL